MPRFYHHRGESVGSPHVFLATPATSLHANYLFAMVKSVCALEKAGIAADYCLHTENCHVDDARNAIVREFLKTDCDALVFIDADVGWDPSDLVKLCRHDRDIVGGVYPLKNWSREEDYPIRMKPGAEIWADADGLVECEGLPTGFLKISRRAIETMVEKFGDRKFWGRNESRDEPPHIILFERVYEDHTRYSGDYAFCRKWQSIGGKLYVDPSFSFSHAGQFEWTGTLGSHWRRKHGVVDANFAQALHNVANGAEGPQDFIALAEYWGNVPWVAGDGLLAAWVAMAREAEGPILECGSGLTTLLAAAANVGTEVWALEHDPEWAARMRGLAVKHGLTNLRIVDAPLVDRWYAVPETMPRRFSLALVDGPPRDLSNRARFTEAGFDLQTVVFDDMDQPIMREMVERFASERGGKAHFIDHPTKNFAICRLGDAECPTKPAVTDTSTAA